jgi:hypothetical protein
MTLQPRLRVSDKLTDPGDTGAVASSVMKSLRFTWLVWLAGGQTKIG